MVHYKLTYFDLRGRAESIRQVFVQAGVPFEDVRIPRDEWPSFKPKTPFGQLPVLEVDGSIIAQSSAILRFLGKQFELTGKTPLEEARLDMIVDQVNDFSSDVKPYILALFGFAPGDKDALLAEVFVPNRDKHFTLLEKNITGVRPFHTKKRVMNNLSPVQMQRITALPTSNMVTRSKCLQDFILGHLTWADIHVANTLAAIRSTVPSALDGFPALNAYVDRVISQPRLKAHIASRPDAPF